jgi:DNA polymerase-3 subunit beta
MPIKFSLPQSELARAVQTVNQAVPTRSALPALTNLHVEVTKDIVRLSATDLDTSVSLRIPCEEAQPGRTLVPARLFTDLVRSLPADVVTVESTGESLRIVSRGGEFVLPTSDADDYPQLPKVDEEKRLSIPASTFTRLVRRVVDFVAADDSRPEMTGVKMEFKKNEVRFVSINGHLLALASVKGEFGGSSDVIVLPSALQYVMSGLAANEVVHLGIAKTQVVFEIGNLTVFSRLLEGKFPEYEKLIPESSPKRALVRREEFHQALRRVDVVADTVTHQVRFQFSQGLLELETQQTIGGGRANVKIEAQYDADPLEIGFNAKYVMELLKTMDTDEVELALDRPLSAMVMAPHPTNEGFRHVCLVMPLRLANRGKP